jgi:pyridoxal phosphate enzyme (YggS family)
MNTITGRIQDVQARLQRAIEKAGRDPATVELMAVSKNHPPEAVCEAAAAGITLFGENRVQEAAAKIPECPGHVRWHLIGHLQRNKARHAVELFEMIHSIDTVKLLETVQRHCEEAGRYLKVLLEVNVSGESVKYGFKPEEVPAVLQRASEFSRLEITGLMTMPPFTEDPEGARPHFARLRDLRGRWQDDMGVALPLLSMGMTHDMEVAVEEGSNMVRIGTAIFGQRPRPVIEGDGP